MWACVAVREDRTPGGGRHGKGGKRLRLEDDTSLMSCILNTVTTEPQDEVMIQKLIDAKPDLIPDSSGQWQVINCCSVDTGNASFTSSSMCLGSCKSCNFTCIVCLGMCCRLMYFALCWTLSRRINDFYQFLPQSGHTTSCKLGIVYF